MKNNKRDKRQRGPLPYDEDFLRRYGIRERTQQEKDEEERKIRYARSLGIMLDCFDESGEVDKKKERDRWEALYYIEIGKEIPKDLMERLLKYKEEDEKSGKYK